MSVGRISLKLRNRLSELNILSQTLERFGETLALPQKTLFELNLALEELVTNIISYGYRDDADHWIQIAISHENAILTIRLEDDGIPFDPVEAEPPDCNCPVEERTIGNLGIYLTKKVMDDMVYERHENKNILTLRKNLHDV
ncbi:MAG: ATP-binding protein [Deltaproteobacteria bacterium]|nr:MAG: ATP-binding protein [Deltaproteobacteria bacterium]